MLCYTSTMVLSGLVHNRFVSHSSRYYRLFLTYV